MINGNLIGPANNPTSSSASGVWSVREQFLANEQTGKWPKASGSVVFDGAGDYLTVPGGTPFSFSGDFTIEFWMKQTASVAYACWFTTVSAYQSSGMRIINDGYGTGLMVGGAGTTNVFPSGTEAGSASFSNNVWYHVAVVRSSAALTFYLNGTSKGTVSYSATPSSDTVKIGQVSDGYYINGYVSNLRVVKGTALYTSNFTPPTAPLTAISGTSLLTCQSGISITDASSNNYTVTAYGNAAASSTSPF